MSVKLIPCTDLGAAAAAPVDMCWTNTSCASEGKGQPAAEGMTYSNSSCFTLVQFTQVSMGDLSSCHAGTVFSIPEGALYNWTASEHSHCHKGLESQFLESHSVKHKSIRSCIGSEISNTETENTRLCMRPLSE